MSRVSSHSRTDRTLLCTLPMPCILGRQVLILPRNETTKPSHNGKENVTPKLEDTGSNCTDVKTQSPDRISPSRRKLALGSLRRIGSLRSIRSPSTKANARDESLTPPEVDHQYCVVTKSTNEYFIRLLAHQPTSSGRRSDKDSRSRRQILRSPHPQALFLPV